METSIFWTYVLISFHLPPLMFLALLIPVEYYIKFITSIAFLLSLYVASLFIDANTKFKSSAIKSGTYLTKSSLTLNDLRIIKYRYIFGNFGDKMTKTSMIANNRKIMSQTIDDNKENLKNSGGACNRAGMMTRSVSHHQKIEVKVNDNVREVDLIDKLIQSKCVKSRGRGSFKLIDGEASLLSIVIKKWRRV